MDAATDAKDRLASFVDRFERLVDEIEGLKGDLKDLTAEIKNAGFNARAVAKLVTVRRSKARLEAETELMNDLVLYAHATGTPLDVETAAG